MASRHKVRNPLSTPRHPSAPTRPETPDQVIVRLEARLASIRDDRDRPEMTLLERARTLIAWLSDIPLAILVANDRARYIDANAAAATLTGYSRAELTHLTLADLTPAGAGSQSDARWRAFLERGRMAGDFVLRRKDGQLLQARFSAVAHVLRGVHLSALAHPILNREEP